MKLHLGAGRVILPVTKETEPVHLAPMPPACFEEGWVNVDKYKNSGIEETVDLFKFPWIRSTNGMPFLDDSVDEIYTSHLVEHIPHEVRVSSPVPMGWAKRYSELCEEYDGWFVFFAECWRVLKPDGLIHVVAPYAMSAAAIHDPTHTRLVTPASFGYLKDTASDAPFDYHIPCHFEPVDSPMMRYTSQWVKQVQGMTSDETSVLARTYFGVCDEVRVTMRAVK